MKRTVIILSLIFALTIALSASIPTLALTSATTTVGGTVKPAIDVSYTGSAPTFTGLYPGTTNTTPAGTVTVQCNKGTWSLKAKDQKTTGSIGYMMNGSTNMAQPLYIAGGTLPSSDLTAERTLLSGQLRTTGSGTTVTNIVFSQATTYADDADLGFSMTVVFTGTMP